MLRRYALMAAGAVVGLVLVEVLLEQERKADEEKERELRNGLFAEITGNTVRMYEVRDGSFCGYTETKVFESQAQAMEWAAKETRAKMIIRDLS